MKPVQKARLLSWVEVVISLLSIIGSLALFITGGDLIINNYTLQGLVTGIVLILCGGLLITFNITFNKV